MEGRRGGGNYSNSLKFSELDIGGLKTCVPIKTMIKNASDKVDSRENSEFGIECF